MAENSSSLMSSTPYKDGRRFCVRSWRWHVFARGKNRFNASLDPSSYLTSNLSSCNTRRNAYLADALRHGPAWLQGHKNARRWRRRRTHRSQRASKALQPSCIRRDIHLHLDYRRLSFVSHLIGFLLTSLLAK